MVVTHRVRGELNNSTVWWGGGCPRILSNISCKNMEIDNIPPLSRDIVAFMPPLVREMFLTRGGGINAGCFGNDPNLGTSCVYAPLVREHP